jgi:hypothetical protein
MAVIIQIRGTSGSGKSHAVRHVIKKLGIKNVVKGKTPGGRDTVVGYRLNGDVMIVSRYEGDVGGGADMVNSQEELRRRVTRFANKGRVVLFEGVVSTTVFTAWSELDAKLRRSKGHEYVWAFMNTPLGVCIRRIIKRRRNAGNRDPFNPKHTILKYYSGYSAACRAMKDDSKYHVVFDYKRAPKLLLKLVRSALNNEKMKRVTRRSKYRAKFTVRDKPRGFHTIIMNADAEGQYELLRKIGYEV